METSKNAIAETIVRQINASDFFARARWGVRMMLSDGNTLQLEVSKSRKIRITLDANDTYTVEIGKYIKKTFTYTVLHTVSGVYENQIVSSVDANFS